MTPPAISFQSIDHAYRSGDGTAVAALDHVNLNVRQREFVVVVGPSGCGKSTLLRMAAGLIAPSAGRVTVFDHPVTGPREDVGFVFQRPTLLPWLDARSNITFPIHHRGNKLTDVHVKRAEELLDLVGLSAFGRKFPDELSGGMQQRVSLARALMTEPDVLLMDEPFSALDALTRDEMCFELLRLWSTRRSTVLFVTHSVAEAVLLGDRIVIMSDRPGRVLEVLTVELPRPRTPETFQDPLFQELSGYLRARLMRRADVH